MTPLQHYARAAGDPAMIRAVVALLAERWDPAGGFVAPDGTRTPDAHARAVLGILGTGPDTANVAGYLRRAEEAALGAARSSGAERQSIALAIWRMLVDETVTRLGGRAGP